MRNEYRDIKDGELTYEEHYEAKRKPIHIELGRYNPSKEASKQVGKRPNVSHYKAGTIQPIDFINSQDLNFNLGNAIKYITRCNYKGTKKADLLKALDYINFELENLTYE